MTVLRTRNLSSYHLPPTHILMHAHTRTPLTQCSFWMRLPAWWYVPTNHTLHKIARMHIKKLTMFAPASL